MPGQARVGEEAGNLFSAENLGELRGLAGPGNVERGLLPTESLVVEEPQAVHCDVTAAPRELSLAHQVEEIGLDLAIGDAIRQLQGGEAEAIPADTQARAQDASQLHGRWNIRHTLHRTNGEGGPPAAPIVPGSWDFTPDGAFRVRGGNTIEGRYTYTGESIVISALGPTQEYRVDRLDESELHVTAVIEAGALRIENTTVLDRASAE